MSSFSSWGCVLKGYFGRGTYFEGRNRVRRALKTSILKIAWELWGPIGDVAWLPVHIRGQQGRELSPSH